MDKSEVEIAVTTSEDKKTITLTFVSDEKNISVGFSLTEAQLLNIYLTDAISAVIMQEMGVEPPVPTQH